MPTAAAFSTVDVLRNGQRVEIRALRSTDREDMLTAVGRTSTQSLYRRFFTVRRHFSEAEASFFLNPDFLTHVALVAVAEEDGKPVIAGGGRMSISNLDRPRWPLRLSISSRVKELVLRSCGISHRLRAKPACESSWQRFCPRTQQC